MLSVPEEFRQYFIGKNQTQITDSLGMTNFKLDYDKNKLSLTKKILIISENYLI